MATVEYDLGEEDIMKLLTFAFAIHIMKGGIYEAYGLGKKKNLTMVPVESVVEKAAQGVVVYPEATDGDGEPIKGENMEELSPRALLVGKPGLEVEECGSLRCSPHLPAPGPTDIEQGVWKHHEVHTVCGVDYVKANPPDLAVLTCEVKSLPGLRDTTGAVESTLLALSVLRLGPLMLPSLMTKDYEVYECGVDYIKANPPDLAVLTCDAKSLPGLRIHLVEEIVQHIINQVSLSNVSQLYIRALTHHAVLLCVLLFVFLYCVIVHCCTGMYPTTGTLISVDIKKITYIHHTEFV